MGGDSKCVIHNNYKFVINNNYKFDVNKFIKNRRKIWSNLVLLKIQCLKKRGTKGTKMFWISKSVHRVISLQLPCFNVYSVKIPNEVLLLTPSFFISQRIPLEMCLLKNEISKNTHFQDKTLGSSRSVNNCPTALIVVIQKAVFPSVGRWVPKNSEQPVFLTKILDFFLSHSKWLH